MVTQFALPKSARDQAKRTDVQDVGFTKRGPELAKYLAEELFAAGEDMRKIFKQTGWSQDIDGVWRYEYGDAGMKVRTDNPNLDLPTEGYSSPSQPDLKPSPAAKARQFQTPKTPMKGGRDEVWTQGKNLQERFEGDTTGELVPSATGSQTITDPLTLNPAGSAPGRYPLIRMRERADPDQIDFNDITGPDTGFWNPGSNDPRPYNQSRNPTFGELFEHPWQEFYQPELGDLPMRDAHYTFGGQGDRAGLYSGHSDPPWVEAYGPQGGVAQPNTMENVMAHEVIGHGGDYVEGRPWGGTTKSPEQEARGKDVSALAFKRAGELNTKRQEDLAHLMNQGVDPDAAMAMFNEMHPNLPDWLEQYRDYGFGRVYELDPYAKRTTQWPPNMIGYMAEGGEANARNIENRAVKLSDRVPMTGEKPWEQFPNSDVAEAQARATPFDDRPLRGDVHPFETLDIPPDLTRNRYYPGSGYHLYEPSEAQPAPGQFDWLLGKGPAAGIAGAGTLATLGLPDPASASEGPQATFSTEKTDRLPAASPVAERQDRLPASQEGRIKEAGQMFAEVPQAMTTGLREAGESALGMGGDMGEYLPGIGPAVTASKALLPSYLNPFKTTEDAAAMTDWLQGYLPEGAQATAKEWTQHEDTSPMDWMYRNIVSNVVDPVDIGLATAGKKLGRVALAKLKGLF